MLLENREADYIQGRCSLVGGSDATDGRGTLLSRQRWQAKPGRCRAGALLAVVALLALAGALLAALTTTAPGCPKMQNFLPPRT